MASLDRTYEELKPDRRRNWSVDLRLVWIVPMRN